MLCCALFNQLSILLDYKKMCHNITLFLLIAYLLPSPISSLLDLDLVTVSQDNVTILQPTNKSHQKTLFTNSKFKCRKTLCWVLSWHDIFPFFPILKPWRMMNMSICSFLLWKHPQWFKIFEEFSKLFFLIFRIIMNFFIK